MLKPEIKKQLIDALRSGEYKQCRGKLRENDCFCVNGVLCDLAVKAGVGKWIECEKGIYNYNLNGCSSAFGLIRDLANWASEKPVSEFGFQESVCTQDVCLMGANDAGESFDELANRLEKATIVNFLDNTLVNT